MNPKRKFPTLIKENCPLGNIIVLSNQCWYNHILIYHPEMQGNLEDVRATIADPDKILENDKERRYNLVYYKEFKGKYKPNNYLRVPAIILEPSKKGIVTSAYPVIDIYGGKEIWKK